MRLPFARFALNPCSMEGQFDRRCMQLDLLRWKVVCSHKAVHLHDGFGRDQREESFRLMQSEGI